MIAKQHAVLIDRDDQRYSEEGNEPQLAQMVGGKRGEANAPVDVVTPSGDGIELKTITKGTNDKITMSKSAVANKDAWVAKSKRDLHTVVFDDRLVKDAGGPGAHDTSKRAVYYRRGYGSFRIGTMHRVRGGAAELRRLIATPSKRLPAAAQPGSKYPRKATTVRGTADEPRDDYGRWTNTGVSDAVTELRSYNGTDKNERAIAVDLKTGERLYDVTGDALSVNRDGVTHEVLGKEVADLHTHPDESSFSDADWGIFGWSHVKEAHVVTAAGTVYTIKKTPAFQDVPYGERSPRALKDAWNEEEQKREAQAFASNVSTEDLIHNVNDAMAKRFNVTFSRSASTKDKNVLLRSADEPRDDRGRWTADLATSRDNLRQYLEMVGNMQGHRVPPGMKHGTVESLVAKEGEDYESDNTRPLPKGVKQRKLGECYMNAYQLADSQPDKYQYVEGFATPGGVPMGHAWTVDRKTGEVVDPTWGGRPEKFTAHVAYRGVPMDIKDVRETVMRRKKYGVLHDPEGGFPKLRSFGAAVAARQRLEDSVPDERLEYLSPTDQLVEDVRRAVKRDWDPSQHPRDENGRFSGEADAEGFRPKPDSPSALIAPPKDDADVPRFLSEVESSPEYRAIQERLGHYAGDVRGGTVEGVTYAAGDVRAWSLERNSRDGKMTPERQRLHDQIAASMLNPKAVAEPGTRPKAVLLMGPPGGGKSSNGLPAAQRLGKEWTVVAPDDVKAHLPGYCGWNASLFQEESSKVGERDVTDRALAANHNVIFDLTGANRQKMVDLTKRLGSRGYDVHVVNIEVQPRTSAARAWSRFVKTGRILPPRYSYSQVDSKPAATYAVLKEMPEVKSWTSISTDVTPSKLVEHGRRDDASR